MKAFLARLIAAHPLALIAGACLIALTTPASVLLWREQANVGALPREAHAASQALQTQLSRVLDGDPRAKDPEDRKPLRAVLVGQIAAMRTDAFAEIDKQATGLRGDATAQLIALRSAADARIGGTLASANSAIAEVHTLNANLAPLLASSSAAVASVGVLASGLSKDLPPVLANTASLVKDAQDSWDDSYYDVRGLVQSSEVAATQVAQTMQTISAQAEPATKALTGIAEDAHGIVGNVREKYFTPEPPAKTFGEKMKRVAKRAWLFGSALVVALARGGAF